MSLKQFICHDGQVANEQIMNEYSLLEVGGTMLPYLFLFPFTYNYEIVFILYVLDILIVRQLGY